MQDSRYERRCLTPAISITVIVLTKTIGDSRGPGYYISVSGTRVEHANVYAAILAIAPGFLLDRAMLWLRPAMLRLEHNEVGAGLKGPP